MDPRTPGEAADSLWRAVDVLRSHDALASIEFGTGMLLDDLKNAAKAITSILSCNGADSVACSSRWGRLEHQNRFLVKALEGQRLYDLVEAFMQSNPYTPLRWACLTVLREAAWIQRIRAQMLYRPALLNEIIATLRFYAAVEPGSNAANVYLQLSSISAVTTLSYLVRRGGGLKTSELAQLGDMGIVPAMTCWFEAFVSAQNLLATERPGPARMDKNSTPGDELGMVDEADPVSLAACSSLLASIP